MKEKTFKNWRNSLIGQLIKNLLWIVVIATVLFGALCVGWKTAYPHVAPMVFDYLVERNAQMFVKLEESLEEALPEAEDTEVPSVETVQDSEQPSTEKSPDMVQPDGGDSPSAPETPSKKPNTDVQTVHTTMGDFTGQHLIRALKNISPADKTRIIAICQKAVSMSDIVTVSQLFSQEGLTPEQQKYIENYLRDNLSVPDKREILEILQKY